MDVLSNPTITIDLILSDILMPKIDGYELYSKVSNDLKFFDIPFIFLTARSKPEDVRIGKLLGVDDYITKPFDEKELIATIEGKIKIKEKRRIFSKQIEENILNNFEDYSKFNEQKGKYPLCVVFLTIWDEIEGPQIVRKFTENKDLPYNLEDINRQLFQTIISIFGDISNISTQGVLLNLKNIDRVGYIYFDFISDSKVRGGKKPFMLSAIAPKINYLESLRIDEEFKKYSKEIFSNEKDIEEVYNKIKDILVISLVAQ